MLEELAEVERSRDLDLDRRFKALEDELAQMESEGAKDSELKARQRQVDLARDDRLDRDVCAADLLHVDADAVLVLDALERNKVRHEGRVGRRVRPRSERSRVGVPASAGPATG